LKIGAIWSGLNTALVAKNLAYTLNNTTARILFIEEDKYPKIEEIHDQLESVQDIVFLKSDRQKQTFESFLSKQDTPIQMQHKPSDPSVIVYTGGTTGLPKGVVLPHFANICAAYRYRAFHRVTPEDRHLTVLQLYHTGGQQMGIWGPMLSEIETVALKRFSASRYWDQVKQFNATILDPMGAMYTMLIKQSKREDDKDRPRKIMWGVTTGVPSDIAKEFQKRFNFQFMEVYALSESGGILLIHNTPENNKEGSNGRGRDWADIAIAGENDELLPSGESGEILLRPKVPYSFMLGYWKDERRTLEVFGNLWLHTGDLGYLDEDGYLYFQGRQAHWLRRRSENISAYEIESVLNDHPSIKYVVIVGVPSDIGEEEVKAYVQLESGKTLAPGELIEWCVGKIAHFKIPRYIEFVEDFPRSQTKEEIERFKLRAMGVNQSWDRESEGIKVR
jgi:crotonobetaine/carnitine-CoA ligase